MSYLSARARPSRQRFPVRVRISIGALVGVGLFTPSTFSAVAAARRAFDLPGGDAGATLKHFAAQSGEQLLYSPDDVSGVRTHPVYGDFIPILALEHMLKGTTLKARQDEKTKAIAISAIATPHAAPQSTASAASSPARQLQESSEETQKNMKRKNPIAIVAGWLALALTPGHAAHGAEANSEAGTIAGRVQNVATGEYLNNARVSVQGTDITAFTDQSGTYQLARVPAGPSVLEVFYTGLDPQRVTLNVVPGQTVQRDVDLTSATRYGQDTGPLKMDSFVVTSSTYMDGAARAINEQRFAPNVMSVVDAGEFGPLPDGNAAEFLKFLPGVTVDYAGGDATEISIDGVSGSMVPVNIGGFEMASANGIGRGFQFTNIAINNMSRVEVSFSPTPETTGSALAGSINMVPRSAFERSKPLFTGRVFVMMRDNDRSFKKTPGPMRDPERKVQPGFNFSYIVPLNKRFGFTLSGASSKQYTTQDFVQTTWHGASAATNGTTFPDTTPDKPYLTSYNVRDGTKMQRRASGGLTLDYKVNPNDRLALSLQYVFFDAAFRNRPLTLSVGQVRPGDFTTTSTHGFAGAGTVSQSNDTRNKTGTTYMPSLTYWHNGQVWNAEAGAGISHANINFTDISKGFFGATNGSRTGLKVSFDDIFYLRPHVITVTDGASGAPVDPYDIHTFRIGNSTEREQHYVAAQRSAYANLRRDFDLRGFPLSLKGGVDIKQSMRDVRGANGTYAFVGPDNRAGQVFDESFSQRVAPYGFPRIGWMSADKMWELYKSNPNYFTLNETGKYTNSVSQSQHAEEVISAAFIRGDLQLIDRRLKLVGGVRAEQTNVTGDGPRTDPTGNFQRDASGNVIRNPNGAPQLIAPAGTLEALRLTMIDRGTRAEKEYLRWFPSINASFNLKENLIARGAYYWSVGRPSFTQYAGALTLPNIEIPPAANNRISVNNVGIKAWSARSVKLKLEYYFQRVGLVSVGAFRRDIENFFGSTVFAATPEFLQHYDLDPDTYAAYDVATNHNLPSTVRMTGVDINYKQALTFLPNWARGVQIFGNGTLQRVTGEAADNFANYIPRSANWGISISRPKFNVRMNWNLRGRHREGAERTGRGIEPGTYQYDAQRLFLDINGEYYIHKTFALFTDFSNVTDATQDREIYGPSTPAHAQFRQRQMFGSLWTFGIKGSF